MPSRYTSPAPPAPLYSYSVVIPHAATHGPADVPHTHTYLTAAPPPHPEHKHALEILKPQVTKAKWFFKLNSGTL